MNNLVFFSCQPRSNDSGTWYSVFTCRMVRGKLRTHESIIFGHALAERFITALCDAHGIHGIDRAGMMRGRVIAANIAAK